MTWPTFKHPDFCPTVVRRQLAAELIELLFGMGEALVSRGRSLTWEHSGRDRAAYCAAVYRLRRAGLVAHRRAGGKPAVLTLTERGRQRLPPVFRPERLWRRKWSGSWHVLVYDVPETRRTYRAALRGFLRKLRMGCLQGSVWVSPDDIRPEYDDLVKAGGVSDYAMLFEARTVLGQPSSEVVRRAWPMDALENIQSWFCRTCRANLQRLANERLDTAALATLMRQEAAAHVRAMERDPLLPRALWPEGYLGPEVRALHLQFQSDMARRL